LAESESFSCEFNKRTHVLKEDAKLKKEDA
jgi:hypothetical protein